METKAGDPGAFAQFDLDRVSSPAFVVDAAKLRANCQVLANIRDEADIKVLAALKAFSMWSTAPIIGEYLDGVCTSGLWEARLASEWIRRRELGFHSAVDGTATVSLEDAEALKAALAGHSRRSPECTGGCGCSMTWRHAICSASCTVTASW